MTTSNVKIKDLKEQLEKLIEEVDTHPYYKSSPSEIHNAQEYIDGFNLSDLKKNCFKYGKFANFFVISFFLSLIAFCIVFPGSVAFKNIYLFGISLILVVIFFSSIKGSSIFLEKEGALSHKIEDISRIYFIQPPDLRLLRSLKLQAKDYNIEYLAELFYQSYMGNIMLGSKKALEVSLIIAQKIIEELSYLELHEKNKSFTIDTKWNIIANSLN